jgi:hypothetical protein
MYCVVFSAISGFAWALLDPLDAQAGSWLIAAVPIPAIPAFNSLRRDITGRLFVVFN